MASSPRHGPRTALTEHRQRQRRQGSQRLEVQVRREDAALLRAVAAALLDPDRAAEGRLLLREHFAPASARSFKEFLLSAPLEELDLERSRDTGRDIKL